MCCDGLTGFPEAIEATWPAATVQTCVVHLIRAAMQFISYADRKKVAAALRPINTALTIEAAETELDTFADSSYAEDSRVADSGRVDFNTSFGHSLDHEWNTVPLS